MADLGVDYLDLYLIHFPISLAYVPIDKLYPPEWVNFYGPVVLITKTVLLGFILVLVRWSFPRFREDQLQNLAWKVLIPLSLLNILITSIMKVVF